ncbi:MAG: hypothetical protein DRG83_10970 [Deltaproteobacteria bacterium]|nr:MAG: hypothetical protein DRG83_10970 [Deltaproteobacteria bacterium]
MSKPKILIVDDIEDYLQSLQRSLERDFEVLTATSIDEAKKKITKELELLLLDIRLDESDPSNRDGLLLLEWSKMNFPEIPVVMMSVYREFDLAVDSLNLGASYFLRKPINVSELKALLNTFIEKGRLARENVQLKEKLRQYETGSKSES